MLFAFVFPPFFKVLGAQGKAIQLSIDLLPGGGGTWVNFWWVCAACLSESLPHYSLFCGHI